MYPILGGIQNYKNRCFVDVKADYSWSTSHKGSKAEFDLSTEHWTLMRSEWITRYYWLYDDDDDIPKHAWS